MGKAKITITNPSANYHSGSHVDFFKDFSHSIIGPDRRYWEQEGAAASGWNYEITKKEIRALSDDGNMHTTLGGKFKFTKQKPPEYSLNMKGSVKTYLRKIENLVGDNSFTTIKATGIRGAKIDKIITAKTDKVSGLYTGRSFLEDAVFEKQKNLDIIINDPYSPSLPTREIGKTTYSLIGKFNNANHQATNWGLWLGKSKEIIDLSNFGKERVTINNFDPNKDSIRVSGDFYAQNNILYIETPGGWRNIASFMTNDNPTFTHTPQEITKNFSIKSI